MSGKGGSSGGGGGGHMNGGGGGIPAASRKMVQSLKEIVKDMTDLEIYATLKDCNMDPDDAVNRLLSQDPFHEVKKTKRDKKKDTTTTATTNDYYSRSRPSNNNNYTRTPASARVPPRKPAPKIEHQNGTTLPPAYSLSNAQPPSFRSTDSVGVFDGLPSSTQHAPLQSSPWMGNPGQRSMADIVKMGRPQVAVNRPSNQQGRASKVSDTNHDEWPSIEHQSAVNEWPSSVVHQPAVNEWPSSVEHQPAVNEWSSSIEHQPAVNEWPSSIEHQPAVNEWPSSIEHHRPAISVSSVVDVVPNSDYYTNSSNFGEANWQQETYDNEYVAEEVPVENPDSVRSASASAKSKLEDNQESNFYQDNDSYQPNRHPFDKNEAEAAAVSSVAANLEQLKLQAEDEGTESEEESPSVVIPDHLQLHTPECLNLSFGSFGCANNAPLSESEPHASRPLKNNLEDTSEAPDVSIIGSSDARNPDYYADEHLTTTSDGNLVHRTGVGAGTYEHSSISQSEALKSEPPEPVQENQYSFPSSSHVYTYENAQQADAAFPHSQTSSQMQDLSPFSNVMQAYTNSLPSVLLDSTVQMTREDIPYSPFPAQQPMTAKYSNIASSIGGATITMPEALRANSISTPQPNPQAQPVANVATGPALQQHLAVHPYSQPTLPLGHYANMIGYPFLPQSYTYMPSAYQQAFAQNSTYHQSLAALLPQYKNSISVSSLPQSAAIPPGYGFGSSTNIPGGNFPLNPPAAPTSTTIGYEDVLNSQYNDNNHMISLQQNENSPMWVHGPGSRTMSAAPPSAYYSIQGQNQQAGGFRQSQQQLSQHFGPLGYPNFYHPQGSISLEQQQQQQQQQNPREASLAGAQSQQSKQAQQLWHNSY